MTKAEYDHFTEFSKCELPLHIPKSLEEYVNIINSAEAYMGNPSSPLTFAFVMHKKSIIIMPNGVDYTFFIIYMKHCHLLNMKDINYNICYIFEKRFLRTLSLFRNV